MSVSMAAMLAIVPVVAVEAKQPECREAGALRCSGSLSRKLAGLRRRQSTSERGNSGRCGSLSGQKHLGYAERCFEQEGVGIGETTTAQGVGQH